MSTKNLTSGRLSQKLRTRKTIIDAANRLIQHTSNPSLEMVAAEAQVSRATIYRYFSNVDTLLWEASIAMDIPDPQVLLANEPPDPFVRIKKIHDYLFTLSVNNEVKFRQLIRATLTQWLEGPEGRQNMRAARRVSMLQEALSVGTKLDKKTERKLIIALSTMMGIESFIVLRDVCEVSAEEGRETMEWAIETLVKAVINDS